MTRAAWGILMALMLTGCAGGQFGTSPGTTQTPAGMAGRWMLAAPNAPVCGLNFGGAPGAREGSVTPEGGCPEKFFMSRRWIFEQDKLTINDRENNPLAHLNLTNDRFEGQSTTGTPVSLSRAPPAG